MNEIATPPATGCGKRSVLRKNGQAGFINRQKSDKFFRVYFHPAGYTCIMYTYKFTGATKVRGFDTFLKKKSSTL